MVNAAASETVTYLHSDTLGNVIGESKADGTFTRYHYKPYGERVESQPERLGFTGHLHQKELGLTYMQARHFDPLMGRFYGNDPVSFTPGNVFSFNRYGYGNNNPYRYTDPDGRAIDAVIDVAFTIYDGGRFLGATAAWAVGKATGDANLANAGAEGMRETGVDFAASAATIVVPGATAPMVRGGLEVVDSAADVAKGASTLKPGPFAKESIPGHMGKPTAAEQKQVNALMEKNGCHTCGTTNPGTKSGNAVVDHQPAQALGETTQFLPHCINCMRRQGGEVLQELIKREGN